MSENQEKPTRDDMIKWYKEEIELATLRAELAGLQRDAAVAESERIQAIAIIAQITQAPEENQEKSRTHTKNRNRR